MADLAAIFEDLQTTLRCCERLGVRAGFGEAEPDDLTLEAFWTTAVLSYARCFSHHEGGTNLTLDDVTATGLAGDVLGWHQVLLRLRDHYADPAVNPRETFSVGVSQDAYGKAQRGRGHLCQTTHSGRPDRAPDRCDRLRADSDR